MQVQAVPLGHGVREQRQRTKATLYRSRLESLWSRSPSNLVGSLVIELAPPEVKNRGGFFTHPVWVRLLVQSVEKGRVSFSSRKMPLSLESKPCDGQGATLKVS